MLSCLVLSCLVLACLVLSCLVLFRFVLFCRVLSFFCLVLSCRVVSCLACLVVGLSCGCLVSSCLVLSRFACRVLIALSARVLCNRSGNQFDTNQANSFPDGSSQMPGGWESLWVEDAPHSNTAILALPRPGSNSGFVDNRVVQESRLLELATATPPQVSASSAARRGGPTPFLGIPVPTGPSATLYGISPLSSDSPRENENSPMENEKEHTENYFWDLSSKSQRENENFPIENELEHNESCHWDAATNNNNVCLQGPPFQFFLVSSAVSVDYCSSEFVITLTLTVNPNTNCNGTTNPNPNYNL
jgi:hypothetical protein